MSASLVGSEMCIRDRWCSSLVEHSKKENVPPTRCACAAEGRRGQAAVSYTHLTLPTICSV
eukprot:12254666-Alexandrium_andersonii.AAC.1